MDVTFYVCRSTFSCFLICMANVVRNKMQIISTFARNEKRGGEEGEKAAKRITDSIRKDRMIEMIFREDISTNKLPNKFFQR